MVSLTTIVLFIILINCVKSQQVPNNIILPKTQYKGQSISQCVKQIFRKYIPQKDIVFFVSINKDYESLLRDINSYNQFLFITRSFEQQTWWVYTDTYLISITNITDFSSGISELSRDLSWNPTAKFIIIWKNITDGNVSEIFKLLITKNIYNVVVVTTNEPGFVELLTYYPFSGSNCGEDSSDIRSLGHCKNLSDIILFPDKIPNGFRNCTIVVAAKEHVPNVILKNNTYSKYLDIGVEQYILKTIAQYEGFNIKYHYVGRDTGFSVLHPNNTITGIFGYLQRGEAKIIIGALLLFSSRSELFDYIYGYSYALFSIFTPVLREQNWKTVYQEFNLLTWLIIFLCFVFTTLIILITIRLTSRKSNDIFLITLKLWRYFYGQVDNNLFRNKYLKRIMIVWILFTNSICAFYNTAMYSLITGNIKDEIKIDPSNLDSLPFKPCMSKDLRTFFSLAYNETLPKNDNLHECEDTDATFQSVASRSDLYTISADYNYFLMASKYEDAEGRPKMNKWDYPRNLISCMYMNKGFPLKHKFQYYALNIFEKGLIQGHLTKIFAKKPKKMLTLKRKYSAIWLEDLIIHFSVLIIGSIISFISFIIELKVGKKL